MAPPSRAPVSRSSADRKVRTMLRVRLLGGLALEADGGPLEPPSSRPARELLAWLALHPGHASAARARDALLARRARDERSRQPAHGAARTAPHAGDAHLATDRERVGLVDVSTDLHRPRPGARCSPRASRSRASTATGRSRPATSIASGCRRCSRRSRTGPDGLRWAREAVKHDPLSEEAAQRLMTAARRRRRPGRGDVGLRAARGPARARAVGRAVARRRAGCWPRSARAPHRRSEPRPTPRLPPVKGPLAGRDAELRALTDATGAVLLAGEPGIGKTRLLAEAGRILHQRRRTVLYGRCYEEQVAPYEPFAEALGADTFAQLLGDAQHERWRLFEAIGARVEDDGPAARRPALGRRRNAAPARAPPAPPEAAGRARRVPRHRDRPDPPARRSPRRPAPRWPRRARAAARARRDRGGDARRGRRPRRHPASRDRRQPLLRRAGARTPTTMRSRRGSRT